MPLTFDLKTYLEDKRHEIDSILETLIQNQPGYASKVCEAMRYSLMAGGKRLRPILMIAGAQALAKPYTPLLPAACAIECIHTYSLIHDDLPAMDDDDLRRGQPTCHKIYGEAVAILAGDGLLTLAFEILAKENKDIPDSLNMKATYLIAKAAGIAGMVGGQCADIESEGKSLNQEELLYIHSHKTAAMIRVSLEAAAVLCNASPEDQKALADFGNNLGLAFQIRDDLLDIEGTEEQIGKRTGSDLKKHKATYPALFGMEQAREKARDLINTALDKIEKFGRDAEPLRAIAKYVVDRNR